MKLTKLSGGFVHVQSRSELGNIIGGLLGTSDLSFLTKPLLLPASNRITETSCTNIQSLGLARAEKWVAGRERENGLVVEAY